MDKESLIKLGIDESWHNLFIPWFEKDGKKILSYLTLLKKKDIKYEPEKRNIFKAFSVPVDQIKIVILGQDPYYSPGFAIGKAFAIPQGKRRPSLDVIKKELFNYIPDIDIDRKFDDTLELWSNQGILLLNSALTVECWKAISHLKMWTPFTKMIIDYLNSRKDPIIFVSMGNVAHKFTEKISDTHTIFKTVHPSADSYATNFSVTHFIGNNIFRKIDEKLKDLEKNNIQWLYEHADGLPF